MRGVRRGIAGDQVVAMTSRVVVIGGTAQTWFPLELSFGGYFQ
jgi:hypothetical protein